MRSWLNTTKTAPLSSPDDRGPRASMRPWPNTTEHRGGARERCGMRSLNEAAAKRRGVLQAVARGIRAGRASMRLRNSPQINRAASSPGASMEMSFNGAVVQRHGATGHRVGYRCASCEASIRPWPNTTEYEYDFRGPAADLTCFNETVAKHHGAQDSRDTRRYTEGTRLQ